MASSSLVACIAEAVRASIDLKPLSEHRFVPENTDVSNHPLVFKWDIEEKETTEREGGCQVRSLPTGIPSVCAENADCASHRFCSLWHLWTRERPCVNFNRSVITRPSLYSSIKAGVCVKQSKDKQNRVRGLVWGCRKGATRPDAISGKSFIFKVMNPPRGMCDLCSLFKLLWITQNRLAFSSDLRIPLSQTSSCQHEDPSAATGAHCLTFSLFGLKWFDLLNSQSHQNKSTFVQTMLLLGVTDKNK